MAPDYIYELVVLEVSRWQRQAWGKLMWRKDVQDTISGCEIFETPFDLYLMGYLEPHYQVPARVICFDYWPKGETEEGKATLYGFDHYRPGRWYEFMLIEEEDVL